MTKIKKISINTVIDAHDLKVISNYVERVKLEPIEVTNFRWIHGIDHQVIIGRKKYIITLRYNKLRTEIEKMSFKVTEVIPEFDQLLIGDPDRILPALDKMKLKYRYDSGDIYITSEDYHLKKNQLAFHGIV